MAAKKKPTIDSGVGKPPETLVDHPFFGLDITDPEQQIYRDALWDKNKRIVFVDAVAGSGKTTIAVGIGCMYLDYGLADGALYIRTPSSEGRIGFLPGDQKTKERPYMQPLYASLIKIGEDPMRRIANDDYMVNLKEGVSGFVPMTDVYVLGSDWERQYIIIDEAQCMTISQLKAILTRCNDSCKVVVIGSTLQIQGVKPEESGFTKCIEHFKDREWAQVCHLTRNYRGEMSAWADKM